jgi:hypothetical protein
MRRLTLLLALMAISLPGCIGNLAKSKLGEDGGNAGYMQKGKNELMTFLVEPPAPPSDPSSTEAKSLSTESKIIKTARLEFQVADLKKSKEKISNLVSAEKGYVSNLEESDDRTRIQDSFTIRVPAGSFDRLVENILKEGSYVSSSKIERKDVTEEFLDLKARMETKKALEARYREVLHQAKGVEDILKVESALGSLREEIEAKEGRLKYLAHQAEYSTILALAYQTLPYTSPPKSEGEGFFSRLASSLVNGWTGLVDFAIGLVTIWPALIIIGGGAYLIVKRIKRNKRMNRSAEKKDPAIIPEKKNN